MNNAHLAALAKTEFIHVLCGFPDGPQNEINQKAIINRINAYVKSLDMTGMYLHL